MQKNRSDGWCLLLVKLFVCVLIQPAIPSSRWYKSQEMPPAKVGEIKPPYLEYNWSRWKWKKPTSSLHFIIIHHTITRGKLHIINWFPYTFYKRVFKNRRCKAIYWLPICPASQPVLSDLTNRCNIFVFNARVRELRWAWAYYAVCHKIMLAINSILHFFTSFGQNARCY